MTPLLPSVSVGTVETRTVIESIRSLVGPKVKYVEAHCADVDPKAKIIICNGDGAKPVSRGDDIKTILASTGRNSGASSRKIKDSGRDRIVLHDEIIVLLFSTNSTTIRNEI